MKSVWTVLTRKWVVSPVVSILWDIFCLSISFAGLIAGITLCVLGSYASLLLVTLSAALLIAKIEYGFAA